MTLHLHRLILNLTQSEVRRDLGNAYDMHRTLARAFAKGPDADVDPFLWRLEANPQEELPILMVQSEHQPSWNQLPDGYLLEQDQRSWTPEVAFSEGRLIMFRVRANPTVNRVPQSAPGEETASGSARGRRKRLGLWSEPDQLDWLVRQAARIGLGEMTAVVSHSERLRCRRGNSMMTVAAAQFDGRAVIVDPIALASAVRSGIGHARMLGLGLLSVIPQRA